MPARPCYRACQPGSSRSRRACLRQGRPACYVCWAAASSERLLAPMPDASDRLVPTKALRKPDVRLRLTLRTFFANARKGFSTSPAWVEQQIALGSCHISSAHENSRRRGRLIIAVIKAAPYRQRLAGAQRRRSAMTSVELLLPPLLMVAVVLLLAAMSPGPSFITVLRNRARLGTTGGSGSSTGVWLARPCAPLRLSSALSSFSGGRHGSMPP
jgi:hypothetical protein